MRNYQNKDYYKALGIEYSATVSEIKTAYRKLVRKYHPDVNKSELSIETFKTIKEAYDVLINPSEKALYDQYKGYSTIYKQTNQAQAKKAYSEANKENPQPRKKEPEKENKAKSTKEPFSKVFNDIMDGLFTADKKTSSEKEKKKNFNKPQNGSDINMNLKISQAESIKGATRKINILHTETCPHCLGRKFINGGVCQFCKGKGEVSLHKKISVKIPPNVTIGSKIRIANEGNKGKYGGKNGDLYLIVDIENNSFFKFEGNNVYCEIPISAFEAALGANIEVPTQDGKITMKIPPLTSSGQKFRLVNQGLTDSKTSQKGDQIVTVKIEMPKALSIEEINLYEQLKTLSKHDVRKDIDYEKK